MAGRIGSSLEVEGRNHMAGDRMGRIGAIFAGAWLSRLMLSPAALLELATELAVLRIQWLTRKSVPVEGVGYVDGRS